jgi:hypothetical protein
VGALTEQGVFPRALFIPVLVTRFVPVPVPVLVLVPVLVPVPVPVLVLVLVLVHVHVHVPLLVPVPRSRALARLELPRAGLTALLPRGDDSLADQFIEEV